MPELGYYGTLGRNTVSGPDQVTVDFSIVKNFSVRPISEEFRIQFRAEMFNILNRANFDVPALEVFDGDANLIGNAGVVSATSTAARQVQFGLKFIW